MVNFQGWKANVGELGIIEVKIPMMASEVQSLLLADSKKLGCLILEIPIVNSDSSLILFLPHNVSSLNTIDRVLSGRYYWPIEQTDNSLATKLDQLIEQLHRTTKRTRVKVFMPRQVNFT